MQRLAGQRLATASSSRGAGRDDLVVVNLVRRARRRRACACPWDDLAGRTGSSPTASSGARFERAGDELAGEGLYVGLEPWASHFLRLAATD